MTDTRVVNIKHNSVKPGTYVYVGRAGKGEVGTFGNPFPRSAPNCLGKFRGYFLDRVTNDPKFRAEVLALRGKVLGCFCVRPNGSGDCHAKIIAAWLDEEAP